MERPSKLVDLKLVSKYCPVVANYSYPRPDRHTKHDGRDSNDRSSLGSEGSAPGLIDDRTDSELSFDDDYQYHAHTSELWDSFWVPVAKEEKKVELEIRPKKPYTGLVPSPQQRKMREIADRRLTAWPLPLPLSEAPRPRNRKPAASYSPFPKPLSLPPRTSSLVPSWQPSRPSGKPRRPPRPDSELITACVQQPSPVMAFFSTSPEPNKSTFSRPVTPITPITPLDSRPSTSMDARPVTPLEIRLSALAENSHSATDLPLRDFKPTGLTTPATRPAVPPPAIQVESEPHSVFDYDDSDSEESRVRPFFRFHKRSDTDTRRLMIKSLEPLQRRRRPRASTAPSSPTRTQPERTSKQEVPGRKRQTDVFVRMLGRRSRG